MQSLAKLVMKMELQLLLLLQQLLPAAVPLARLKMAWPLAVP